MGRKRKAAPQAKGIKGLKYFRTILEVLGPLRELPAHGNRDFFYDDYVGLLLLASYNPLLDSLRSLQRATGLENVQEALGLKQMSLAAMSESIAKGFNPADLKPVLLAAAAEAAKLPGGGGLDARLDSLAQTILAVDGSFLRCVPSMVWALFRRTTGHKSAKLHLHLDVRRGAPCECDLTAATASEKKVLRRRLKEAMLYILDRGYADYSLFQEIHDAASLFVARLKENASYEVLEKRLVSAADLKAGVVHDYQVKLGSNFSKGKLTAPARVVVLRGEDGKEVSLLTNSDLEAELIGLIYRYRWQVELFFRWFKCILGCTHWMSRSEAGVTIQVYVALLASVLLSLWTGRKPSKAAFQMFCLYFQGWASEQELRAHLAPPTSTRAGRKPP